MDLRARALVSAIVLSLSLAGCGGGGSSGGGNYTPPGGGTGSVSITPASLSFSAPGAASQQFTVSSTVPGITSPQVDPIGCAPVVSIGPPSSSTLPATYTVSPTGNGSCSFVVNVGHQSATIGITVGGGSGGSVSGNTTPITLTVGGGPGTFTATASSGTLTPDSNACAGIVQVNGSGGPSPQTFTLVPLAAGTCTFTVVDGASSISVPITVNAPSGGAAVFVSPTSMTFASPSAAAQNGTITNTGQIGQVSINESECDGSTTPSLKIAYLTILGVPPGQPVSLPANFSVTPYGPSFNTGTCHIYFVPQVGTPATLTVTVQ